MSKTTRTRDKTVQTTRTENYARGSTRTLKPPRTLADYVAQGRRVLGQDRTGAARLFIRRRVLETAAAGLALVVISGGDLLGERFAWVDLEAALLAEGIAATFTRPANAHPRASFPLPE